MMKLYYYSAKEGNFGDDLNKWIWHEMLPGIWDQSSDTWFSGIGTILAPWMPREPNWVIFTSGTGYGSPSIDLSDPCVRVVAVRGPLTAKALNLSPNAAVTDGAVLLSQLARFNSLPSDRRSGATFIPHRSALGEGRWQDVCHLAGINFVDPRSDSEEVIQAIRHSKIVLADSMHAAIIADTLRVPWIPLSTSMEINSFKWLDWAQSMAVPYNPIRLSPSTPGEAWKNRVVMRKKINVQKTNDPVSDALELYAKAKNEPDKSELIFASRPFRASLRAVRSLSSKSLYERYLNNAASALLKASEGESFLSDDAIFSRRSEETFYRLLQVRDCSSAAR